MTSRTAVIATIALVVVLMAMVALAAMFAGEIPERSGAIVTTVLGTFATVLAGLLLFLRLDTINTKADVAAEKADTAAAASTVAAQKSAVIEQKVDSVRHDIHNDVLRQKVFAAILEAENDPKIRALRAENAAKGVSLDRHAKAQTDTADKLRTGLEQRVARRIEGD